jgi:hypothetical protein
MESGDEDGGCGLVRPTPKDVRLLVTYMEDPAHFQQIHGESGKTANAAGRKLTKLAAFGEMARYLHHRYLHRHSETEGLGLLSARNMQQRWTNIRKKFTKVYKQSKSETGLGLTKKEMQKKMSVQEKLEIMSPCFTRLKALYGERANVSPVAIIELGLPGGSRVSDDEDEHDLSYHDEEPDSDADGVVVVQPNDGLGAEEEPDYDFDRGEDDFEPNGELEDTVQDLTFPLPSQGYPQVSLRLQSIDDLLSDVPTGTIDPTAGQPKTTKKSSRSKPASSKSKAAGRKRAANHQEGAEKAVGQESASGTANTSDGKKKQKPRPRKRSACRCQPRIFKTVRPSTSTSSRSSKRRRASGNQRRRSRSVGSLWKLRDRSARLMPRSASDVRRLFSSSLKKEFPQKTRRSSCVLLDSSEAPAASSSMGAPEPLIFRAALTYSHTAFIYAGFNN